MLKVLETGPQATFQDLGRTGYSGLGVSPSGAFDRGAARRANRMLGNDENSAVIEILFGGFEVVAEKPVRIVFTGTDADVFVDKRRMRTNTVLDIQKAKQSAWKSAQGCALTWVFPVASRSSQCLVQSPLTRFPVSARSDHIRD